MTAEENEPKPLRIIGKPVRKNGKYILNEYALLGKECGWLCPRCNNEVRITPQQAGEHVFVCKLCNASFHVTVDADAVTFLPQKKNHRSGSPSAVASVAAVAASDAVSAAVRQSAPPMGIVLNPVGHVANDADTPVDKPQQPSSDEPSTQMADSPRPAHPTGRATPALLQWGGFFRKKTLTLCEGSTIIGRDDKTAPSDLQFDDPEMSRRSVRIDAARTILGTYTFTLTVMKSLNPVKVNGKPVGQGNSVRLNSGDVITLGRTSLTFKQK